MPSQGSCKCLHCHDFFKPNPRSKGRQKYCSLPDCRKASKTASQKKWLNKPENQDYFRGPDQVRRVQQWRANNPGYHQKPNSRRGGRESLQEPLIVQYTDCKEENDSCNAHPLQELLSSQPSVLIGLIAHLTGSTLQDEIVQTGIRLRELGDDFLSSPTGDHYEYPPFTQPQTAAPNSRAI